MQSFETTNYLCLYGLHEKYLNNIISRYEEGLINDLILYFRELWACAIFHDRFPDLRDEVMDLLRQQSHQQSDQVVYIIIVYPLSVCVCVCVCVCVMSLYCYCCPGRC